MHLGQAGAPSRLPQLDALRGAAALIVVAHHGYLSLPEGDPVREWCLGRPELAMVTLGRPAVILFFTLSGFVLTLSPADSGGARYCARRAVRLLIPFWAALCFAALLYACVPQRHAAAFSPWFNAQWDAIGPWEVLSSLPLLVGPGHFAFDHVMWSLLHELRLSLALPLVLLVARRLGTPACLAIGAAFAAAAEVAIVRAPSAFPHRIRRLPVRRTVAPGEPRHQLPVPARLRARGRPRHALGPVSRWAAARPAATLAVGFAGLAALSQRSEYAMMFGSVAAVAVASTSACVARGLANGPMRWLGRVSFSLYLTHLPIVLTLGLALDGKAPAIATVVLGTILSLLFAEAFHVFVEKPSIAASRRLTVRRVPAVPALDPA